MNYLIKLPSKLLILELKHESQKDTMDVTDKIKTLHKYIDSEYSSTLNIDGGFVIEHDEVFMFLGAAIPESRILIVQIGDHCQKF